MIKDLNNEKKPAALADSQAMESFRRYFNALISTPQFQAEFIRAASVILDSNRLNAVRLTPSPHGK